MKSIFLRLCLTALMLHVSTASYAYDVCIDGIYYDLISKAKIAEVTNGDSQYEGSVTIPQTITYDDIEYQVETIKDRAFLNCTSLTSITIGNSVTSIGQYAFHNCTSLTSVTIGNSVTTFEYSAFGNCQSLASITIPNSVTSIGKYAFQDCSSLTSILIPNSVTNIGFDAFQFCTSLTSVTIPNSVTSIASYIFWGCTSLTSVNIPNSVKYISDSAFKGCTSLTSVNIPNSVKYIYDSAFKGCTSLTSITIPESIKEIFWYAFADCINLESVICYCKTPAVTHGELFEGSYIEYATLYVPDGTVKEYSEIAPWSNFGKILPLSQVPEGIERISDVPTTTISYDINGCKQNNLSTGIRIIKESNGNTRKVIFK